MADVDLTIPLASPAPAGVLALAAGMSSVVTVYGNRKATGSVTYGGNLSAGNTVTINGVVFTAVASGATGNQFNVGVDLTTTLDNLVTAVGASASAAVDAVTVVKNQGATGIDVTAVAYGTGGNSLTLAASGGSPTVSGATLTGGTGGATGSIDIPPDIGTVHLITTSGGAQDFFLPAGQEGQTRTFFFKTRGGSSDALLNGTFGGGTVATFNAADDLLQVIWLDGAWRTLVATSVTIA